MAGTYKSLSVITNKLGPSVLEKGAKKKVDDKLKQFKDFLATETIELEDGEGGMVQTCVSYVKDLNQYISCTNYKIIFLNMFE